MKLYILAKATSNTRVYCGHIYLQGVFISLEASNIIYKHFLEIFQGIGVKQVEQLS